MSYAPPLRRLQDTLRTWVPMWMQSRPGFQTLWNTLQLYATVFDYGIQASIEGVRAAWPGYDGRTDSIAYQAQSRGLVQGETESDEAFFAREILWLDDWALAGHDLELAKQLHTWIGDNPMVRVWNRLGRCSTVAADGTQSQAFVSGGLDWDSISNPERAGYWTDNWIVIYSTEIPFAPNINQAPRTGIIPSTDARRSVGVGHLATRRQRDTILGLVNTWKGQHANIRMIVWCPDSTLFDPANPSASGNPNGRWGAPAFFGNRPSGTSGTATVGMWPSRNRSLRYWVPGQ